MLKIDEPIIFAAAIEIAILVVTPMANPTIPPIISVLIKVSPIGSTNITGLLLQYANILKPMRSPFALIYPSALRNLPQVGL